MHQVRVQVRINKLMNWCEGHRRVLWCSLQLLPPLPLLLLSLCSPPAMLRSSTLSVTEMQQPGCLSVKQLGAGSAGNGS